MNNPFPGCFIIITIVTHAVRTITFSQGRLYWNLDGFLHKVHKSGFRSEQSYLYRVDYQSVLTKGHKRIVRWGKALPVDLTEVYLDSSSAAKSYLIDTIVYSIIRWQDNLMSLGRMSKTQSLFLVRPVREGSSGSFLPSSAILVR